MVICKSHFSSGHFTHNQRAKSGQLPPGHYRFTFSTHLLSPGGCWPNERSRLSRSTIAARFSPAGIVPRKYHAPVAIRTIFRATSHLSFSSRRRRNLCSLFQKGEAEGAEKLSPTRICINLCRRQRGR